MTTWPSSNKGSTAHTDSDNDKPRLARPEINKNISNVNDIIDYFNVEGIAYKNFEYEKSKIVGSKEGRVTVDF